MRTFTTLFIGLALLLSAAPDASAQDRDRDHRTRRRPPPPEPPPPPAATPSVKGFSPSSGAPGTTVKIRGSYLEDAIIVFGRRTLKPSRVSRGSISFVVPDVSPGPKTLAIRYGGGEIPIGEFQLLSSGPGYAEPVPPPPPPPRHGDRPPPRRGDRPIVTSYFPRVGQPGTDVTIRGRNLDSVGAIYFDGREVKPRQVRPNQIRFRVPKRASTGMIVIQRPGARRDLVVGEFQVARFDRRAYDRELRDLARTRWEKRHARLAREEAARYEAMKLEEARLARERAERRRRTRAAMTERFERAFLADPEVQEELAIHAERMARLARMLRIAEVGGEVELAIRIEMASERERRRHERRMKALRASFAN